MDDDQAHDWLLNTIHVIGPAADIERFAATCMTPASEDADGGETPAGFDLDCFIPMPTLHDRSIVPWRLDFWGTGTQPFDVAIEDRLDACVYSFFFSSAGGFPEPVFEVIAERFPRLAFDCFSLEFNNEYMQLGWFNTPPGGDDFHWEEDVPRGCPATEPLRDVMSAMRHIRLVEELKRLARSIS